jgi:hypothetical protein
VRVGYAEKRVAGQTRSIGSAWVIQNETVRDLFKHNFTSHVYIPVAQVSAGMRETSG